MNPHSYRKELKSPLSDSVAVAEATLSKTTNFARARLQSAPHSPPPPSTTMLCQPQDATRRENVVAPTRRDPPPVVSPEAEHNAHLRPAEQLSSRGTPRRGVLYRSPRQRYVGTDGLLSVSDPEIVIGCGSGGTVVLKGSFRGRDVAVKRMMSPFVRLVVRELNILRKSDSHPNIIRYFYDTSDTNFQYIALELCPASLADIMERRNDFQHIIASFVPKRALMEITSGLAHLHALRLVHRDIKPQNILVSEARWGGEHRMLISDFGLCKQLDFDQMSFTATTPGTLGWRAPEVLRSEVKLDGDIASDETGDSQLRHASVVGAWSPTRQTQLVDIFSLGCLYYYVLTEGEHPFGASYRREPNILKDAKSLENLKDLVAVHAIERMLSSKAEDRPDATTCLLHPYLWGAEKMLIFLQEASNRLQSNRKGMLDELENDAGDIVGQDWRAELHPHFISHFSEKRRYNGKSVGDLLRLVRNARHHLYELPDDVRNELGMMPEGFLKYFTDRFPKLFLRVYNVVSSSSLRGEQAFESYFQLPEKSRPAFLL